MTTFRDSDYWAVWTVDCVISSPTLPLHCCYSCLPFCLFLASSSHLELPAPRFQPSSRLWFFSFLIFRLPFDPLPELNTPSPSSLSLTLPWLQEFTEICNFLLNVLPLPSPTALFLNHFPLPPPSTQPPSFYPVSSLLLRNRSSAGFLFQGPEDWLDKEFNKTNGGENYS